VIMLGLVNFSGLPVGTYPPFTNIHPPPIPVNPTNIRICKCLIYSFSACLVLLLQFMTMPPILLCDMLLGFAVS
uniref:Uncharacterized protein n=1 Tax=Melopsittacus undulatus TaxID=13146 RepID=A0A8V5GWC0_MELUD